MTERIEVPTVGSGRTNIWIIIIAFWAILFTIAGSLALALAIWKIIGAF